MVLSSFKLFDYKIKFILEKMEEILNKETLYVDFYFNFE